MKRLMEQCNACEYNRYISIKSSIYRPMEGSYRHDAQTESRRFAARADYSVLLIDVNIRPWFSVTGCAIIVP
jgi:hypothetical protein